MNKIVIFWGKPRTIENVIKNRKISWLELFYDLIFAVVFSRLTESLLEHQTLTGFINAILTFFWLIWGWGELSGYFDNHGNDSIINILIINIDMILIGVSLYLVIIDGNLESKILFSFSLILMLLMIRVLFLISIHFKLSKLEVKLSWILLIEMIINLAAAFLPAMGMILLDILVLIIIAGQGRIILKR